MLFGGNFLEYDVLKCLVYNIYDVMDKNKYEIDLFLIMKNGIVLSDVVIWCVFDGELED